jgi:hypothetical protein
MSAQVFIAVCATPLAIGSGFVITDPLHLTEMRDHQQHHQISAAYHMHHEYLSGGDRHRTDIRQTLRLPGTMFSCKAPLQQLLKFRSTTRSSKRNGAFQEEPGSICIAFVWIICNHES